MSNSSDTRASFLVCFRIKFLDFKLNWCFGCWHCKKEKGNAMKRLLLFVVLFCVSWSVMAQDVIVKKDGSTILSKVMEINDAEIKYKKWSNQDGPVYSIKRVEVSSINYQNGEVEKYADEVTGSQSNLDLPVYTGDTLKVDNSWWTLPLYLGEKELAADEELRTILGKEGFENYESARRMGNAAGDLQLATIVLSVVGLPMGIASDNITAKTIGYFGFGVSIPCFVLSRVFWNIGKNKASAVVTEYNSGVENIYVTTKLWLRMKNRKNAKFIRRNRLEASG